MNKLIEIATKEYKIKSVNFLLNILLFVIIFVIFRTTMDTDWLVIGDIMASYGSVVTIRACVCFTLALCQAIIAIFKN